MRRILLDYNAGAPLEARVLEAMLPWLRKHHGNPSSLHFEGREARRAVEDARDEVAALLAADPGEVVFTSGATEANVTALRSVAGERGRHPWICVSAVEHPSVLETAAALEAGGARVTRLPVDSAGRLALASLEEALAGLPDLVAVMAANNEVGTIQPWADVAARCAAEGVRVHVDAVQVPGKAAISVRGLEGATASVSAHKMGGPKGIGALWVRRGTKLLPLLHGGGQERGRRAGTENVAAIVGFGAAARLAREERERREAALREAEDLFLAELRRRVPEVVLHGPERSAERLAGTLCLRIPGVPGEYMLLALDQRGVSVSLGSACSSGAVEPSHVLAAMGNNKVENLESFRVSLGWSHPKEEVLLAAERCAEAAVARIRR